MKKILSKKTILKNTHTHQIKYTKITQKYIKYIIVVVIIILLAPKRLSSSSSSSLQYTIPNLKQVLISSFSKSSNSFLAT